MVYGDADDCAKELLSRAAALSPEQTERRIGELDCDAAFKARLTALMK